MKLETLPVLTRFSDVADPARYVPVPDDWVVFMSDVVDSSAAIDAGRYKAVNLAGAATISAASNALNGALSLFAFGGDGAGFVVAPEQVQTAQTALARVAAWASRDLELELRVGKVTVGQIREAGQDLRAAFWQASQDVRYAMFDGGGMAWTAVQLKSGAIRFAEDESGIDPDLTGLSCQWDTVPARQGKIASLIVKRGEKATPEQFADLTAKVIDLLESGRSFNPVPSQGPTARLDGKSLRMQLRVPAGKGNFWRAPAVFGMAVFAWTLFRTGLRLGSFDPVRYRREITSNTDYRKFEDGLMITADCPLPTIERLRSELEAATQNGLARFGLHLQDEALMTCVAPSVTASDHIHFVDGAGGGYTLAARQMAA